MSFLGSQINKKKEADLAFENREPNASNVDLDTLLKATQAIAQETKWQTLLTQILTVILENAGADRGVLLLKNELDGQLHVEIDTDQTEDQRLKAEGEDAKRLGPRSAAKRRNEEGESVIYHAYDSIPRSIIEKMEWMEAPLILENVSSPHDPYFQRFSPKSVLCAPILHQGRLLGVIYSVFPVAHPHRGRSLERLFVSDGFGANACERYSNRG